METVWREKPLPDAAERIAASGIEPRLGALLALRGVESREEADAFLRPTVGDLHDPMALAGMEAAVERLLAARESGALVVVVGDYDVDGLSATALLIGAFRALGLRAEAILPSRRAGGYGLQPRHVERAAALGAGLIVTADCGTGAHSALASAAERAIPVVVTDHHLPDAKAPAAAALVNPKQGVCAYPFRELSGAGIALKLAAALYLRLKREPPWDSLLRMACLGTIADAVPLTGENRILAKLGLAALPASRSPGIQALLRRAQVGAPLSAGDVAFRLGPRLNAPGRVGDPDAALDLLLERDSARAGELADQLERANRQRQELERRVLDDCEAELARREGDPIFVAWSAGWHKGVVGIAAGRLAREIDRPVLLFACEEDGTATGSGRSVARFDLHEFLSPMASELIRFGGHSQAVGMTAASAKLDQLRERWITAVAGRIERAAARPHDYDLRLAGGAVDLGFARSVAGLEPFGAGNPEPIFRIGPLSIAAPARRFGDGHLRFVANDGGDARIEVVAWRGARHETTLGSPFEVLGAIEVDRYGGSDRARVRLVAARPFRDGD